MERKKTNLPVVIINCICARIWNAHLIVDIVYGYTSTVMFVLHVVCAIVWDLCAVIWIFRYLRSKKNEE